jgi:cob(I)alamin adenosyltransferase
VLAKNKITSGEYDVIILDEINYAVKLNLIPKEDVINILKLVPRQTTIVLTGNYALPEIIDMADLVTEMKEIKHPYRSGLKAKEGIDY